MIDLLEQGSDEEQLIAWEKKRAFVELLVKGVLVETRIDEAGQRYQVARVIYSFERPQMDVPIPAEMVPLFDRVIALTSTLNGAIIAQSLTGAAQCKISANGAPSTGYWPVSSC